MKRLYGALLCSGLLLAVPSAANAAVVISSVDILRTDELWSCGGPHLAPRGSLLPTQRQAISGRVSMLPLTRSPWHGGGRMCPYQLSFWGRNGNLP